MAESKIIIETLAEVQQVSELIKGRECIECERLFKCPGKSKEVEFCLHFIERGKENDSKGIFNTDQKA